MPLQTILYEKKERIGYITLNRPERLNALNQVLMQELRTLLDEIEEDDEVRVVILTGAGRAFSSGFDISGEGQDPNAVRTPESRRSGGKRSIETFLKIWNLSKPVIAALNGYTLGGACELAQLCDIKIASDKAIFGEPEIRFGSGPPLFVTPFSVGLAKGKELFLTGDMISAQEAERIGMINRVVPHEKLMEEAERMAKKLMLIAQVGLKYNKIAVNRAFEMMGFLNAIQHNMELTTMFDISPTEENAEFNRIRQEQGLRAALNWRDARFKEYDQPLSS